MNKKYYLAAFFVVIFTNFLNAISLEIENFDHYANTEQLHADVFSFGTAAQAGRPFLSIGTGVNNTNAAEFVLTWQAGNNANLIFNNLSAVSDSLIEYEKIEVTLFMNVADGFVAPSEPTAIKLAIGGGTNGTIWQTRNHKAVLLKNGAFSLVSFKLTDAEMIRVAGSESLKDVLENTSSIRLRFENTRQSEVREHVYIDSIKAVTAFPKSGTIIELGFNDNIKIDFKRI